MGSEYSVTPVTKYVVSNNNIKENRGVMIVQSTNKIPPKEC